ncbi:hypothetical protein [Streptomyces gossypiisoli]|uniref:hypothetical protein n=1 Tax=Streptomyces gossypiisoli TaxID=2748864 RepID=UPI0015D9ED19|nr:hypothetical protein [Streptomyces gossypiisoli]
MPIAVTKLGRTTKMPTALPLPVPDGGSFAALPGVILLVHNVDPVLSRTVTIPSVWTFTEMEGEPAVPVTKTRTRTVTLAAGERAFIRVQGTGFVQDGDNLVYVDADGGNVTAVVLQLDRYADLGPF